VSSEDLGRGRQVSVGELRDVAAGVELRGPFREPLRLMVDSAVRGGGVAGVDSELEFAGLGVTVESQTTGSGENSRHF